MSMKISVVGDNGSNVDIAVSSAYNPDILDDMVDRACRAFRDALKAQTEIMEAEDAEAEVEEA